MCIRMLTVEVCVCVHTYADCGGVCVCIRMLTVEVCVCVHTYADCGGVCVCVCAYVC